MTSTEKELLEDNSQITIHRNKTLTDIFSKFTYGLYTLSCGDNVCIIDIVMQITSAKTDKVTIAISINKQSETGKLIRENEDFAVGVLADYTPKEIVEQFGFGHSSEKNKFYNLEYLLVDGIRIPYEYLVSYLICRPVNQIEFSDHYLIIGEVIDYKYLNEEEPLTYKDYKEMN